MTIDVGHVLRGSSARKKTIVKYKKRETRTMWLDPMTQSSAQKFQVWIDKTRRGHGETRHIRGAVGRRSQCPDGPVLLKYKTSQLSQRYHATLLVTINELSAQCRVPCEDVGKQCRFDTPTFISKGTRTQ